jgi:hypothetical protein
VLVPSHSVRAGLLCASAASASGLPARLLNEREHRLGWVSALDLEGRTIRIVDAHGYGKRFVVRADEMLTAYAELERAIHEFAVDLMKHSAPLKWN